MSDKTYKPNKQHSFYSDLVEVWQDVVSIKHLIVSISMCILLCMGGYLFGLWLIPRVANVKPELLKGYALFFGVSGCLISTVISCINFKPKRILIEEATDNQQFLEALKEQNISTESELKALKSIPPEIRRELEDVEVYKKFIEIIEMEQKKSIMEEGL